MLSGCASTEPQSNNGGNSSSQYHTKDTTFTKIFVGGLPYHTTDASLRAFFERFGEIEEAVVITDRQTGKSRGYGFVTMMKKEEALQAIKDPNPCIDGRKANVNLAVLGAKPRVIAGEEPVAAGQVLLRPSVLSSHHQSHTRICGQATAGAGGGGPRQIVQKLCADSPQAPAGPARFLTWLIANASNLLAMAGALQLILSVPSDPVVRSALFNVSAVQIPQITIDNFTRKLCFLIVPSVLNLVWFSKVLIKKGNLQLRLRVCVCVLSLLEQLEPNLQLLLALRLMPLIICSEAVPAGNSCDLGLFASLATANQTATPAPLLGTGQVNPALLSSLITLNVANPGTAAATSHAMFPTTPTPGHSASPLSSSLPDFQSQHSPYLHHPVSMLGAPNPFALAQYIYGANPWLDGGHHQQPFNAAPNPLGVSPVSAFTGTFPTPVDGMTRETLQRNHVAAQLMAGDALTKQTPLVTPTWSSAFPAHVTTPVPTTSVMNDTRASPGFAMVGGSPGSAIGGVTPVFGNTSDAAGTTSATALQTKHRGFI
ncbi:unnamed protein product [Mesocestoides corti]|uniref:RRM domain-containing protein n=1 Tax=Mesocestoides corti TaxID=53468 RepID=A0A0R3U5G0_MESCO|nr:unnamed protein product [Mesocestoides corti]